MVFHYMFCELYNAPLWRTFWIKNTGWQIKNLPIVSSWKPQRLPHSVSLGKSDCVSCESKLNVRLWTCSSFSALPVLSMVWPVCTSYHAHTRLFADSDLAADAYLPHMDRRAGPWFFLPFFHSRNGGTCADSHFPHVYTMGSHPFPLFALSNKNSL